MRLGQRSVGLDAERVKEERVGFALVVKGVDEHADVIVFPDVVALRDGSAHFARLVGAAEGYVPGLAVIAEKHLGGFGRRDVIARLYLVKILQHDRRPPHFIIELAVYDGRFFEFGYRDGACFFGRESYGFRAGGFCCAGRGVRRACFLLPGQSLAASRQKTNARLINIYFFITNSPKPQLLFRRRAL